MEDKEFELFAKARQRWSFPLGVPKAGERDTRGEYADVTLNDDTLASARKRITERRRRWAFPIRLR